MVANSKGVDKANVTVSPEIEEEATDSPSYVPSTEIASS